MDIDNNHSAAGTYFYPRLIKLIEHGQIKVQMVFNKPLNTEYRSIATAGTARSKCLITLLLVQSSIVLHFAYCVLLLVENPVKINLSSIALLLGF